MAARLVVLLALVACSDASLGDGPDELSGAADAAPEMPDAAPPADAEPVPTDCETPSTFFRDVDSDGYGDPAQPTSACAAPAGYVADSTDCDDGRREVNPGAVELCGDLLDNDCSGADACLQAQVAHWAFDTDAADRSGNGNDGAPKNGAQFAGGAAVFDGNNDYVEVANNAAFVVASGTLSVWFNVDAVGQHQGVWSKDSDQRDDGGHLSLWVEAGGEVRVRLQSATNSYQVLSAPITAGTDYHAVATFGAGGLVLYLNGGQVATNAYTGGTQGNQEPIAIGASTHNSGDLVATPIVEPFGGRVHDARFYNRALSGTEVSELYATSAPTAP